MGSPMGDDRFLASVAAALESDVLRRQRLGGGDVADSSQLELADGRVVFAKTHAAAPPGCFTTEAAGLEWMRATGAVAVPRVLAVSDGGDPEGAGPEGAAAEVPNFLVLEWIEEGRPTAATEAELGRALAAMHAGGTQCFGRPDRRTTGSRGLPNEPCDTWAEFYATQRLLPLARLARDCGALPEGVIGRLERLAARLDAVGGPPEPPALLHGDLWAGNRLVDIAGRSWLIDPACHGGHREFDLAMMRLFGGYGEACFASYADRSPLAPGWQDRIALHQVAPLVVHAIKFGGGYVGAATSAIGAYR